MPNNDWINQVIEDTLRESNSNAVYKAVLIICTGKSYINITLFLLLLPFLICKMERYIYKIPFYSTIHSTAI